MRELARSILKARMRAQGIDKLFKPMAWHGKNDRLIRESKFSRAWRRHHYA